MIIKSLHDISEHYDWFLVDVWGVVHNGRQLFPFVKDTLEELRDMGKEVVFLTNSPTRAHTVEHQLATQFGLDRSTYHGLLSSGEDAYKHLSLDGDEHYPELDRKCLAFVDGHMYNQVLQDCHLERVGSLDEASFILNLHPPFHEGMTNQHYEALLHEAQKADKPMVCVNPDINVIYDNTLYPCAGSLAQFYQSIGGTVYYHGKPFPSIYKSACRYFSNAKKTRILAIGDSLETDIQGAKNYGIDSLLVLSGLDAHLARTKNIGNDDEIADQLLNGHTVRPTYVCSEFR